MEICRAGGAAALASPFGRGAPAGGGEGPLSHGLGRDSSPIGGAKASNNTVIPNQCALLSWESPSNSGQPVVIQSVLFVLFPGIHPREVIRLTGGLPRQFANWLAMTGNSMPRREFVLPPPPGKRTGGPLVNAGGKASNHPRTLTARQIPNLSACRAKTICFLISYRYDIDYNVADCNSQQTLSG